MDLLSENGKDGQSSTSVMNPEPESKEITTQEIEEFVDAIFPARVTGVVRREKISMSPEVLEKFGQQFQGILGDCSHKFAEGGEWFYLSEKVKGRIIEIVKQNVDHPYLQSEFDEPEGFDFLVLGPDPLEGYLQLSQLGHTFEYSPPSFLRAIVRSLFEKLFKSKNGVEATE